jgi:hypothetical protein
MTTLLLFVARISIVLYALAAAGVFFAARGLIVAHRSRRTAVFGLEREAARLQRRRSASTIITLLLLSSVVYVIQSIIVPNLDLPTAGPTPTPIVFVPTQVTGTPALLLYPTITPTAGLPPAQTGETPTPPPEAAANGCDIIGATITKPAPNDLVSGQVQVEGEVNVLNFGLYKFEVMGPSTNGTWVVVGTYLSAVPSGLLGVWDATSLIPGDYSLRLVVYRTDGSLITPCVVPITIGGRQAVPSGP